MLQIQAGFESIDLVRHLQIDRGSGKDILDDPTAVDRQTFVSTVSRERKSLVIQP